MKVLGSVLAAVFFMGLATVSRAEVVMSLLDDDAVVVAEAPSVEQFASPDADGICECCCDPGLLGGLIQPSDHCFDDFISPMTNPVFFEDPRTLTEARVIFLNHWLPTAL